MKRNTAILNLGLRNRGFGGRKKGRELYIFPDTGTGRLESAWKGKLFIIFYFVLLNFIQNQAPDYHKKMNKII